MRKLSKVKKIGCSTALAYILLCIGLRIIGFNYVIMDGIHRVWREGPIGIESPFNKYRLVEATDNTGKFIIYCILDDDYQILYTTTEWYHRADTYGYAWAIDSNDFFIITHESSIILYRYVNRKWEQTTHFYWKHSADGLFIEDSFFYTLDTVNGLEHFHYDIAHVPDIVLRHTRNRVIVHP